MANPDAHHWRKAIGEELGVLKRTNTWKICDLSSGRHLIKAKLVFKRVLNPDGTIDRYRVRLVAYGYAQKEDVDVFEIYAPVIRYDSVRALLSEAARLCGQFDIRAVFLNAELEDKVYLSLPNLEYQMLGKWFN